MLPTIQLYLHFVQIFHAPEMLEHFSDGLTKARKTSAMKIKKERTLIPLQKR
jgi:hypothetical protein